MLTENNSNVNASLENIRAIIAAAAADLKNGGKFNININVSGDVITVIGNDNTVKATARTQEDKYNDIIFNPDNYKPENIRPFITESNGKTCVPSFNLLAGNRAANYIGYQPRRVNLLNALATACGNSELLKPTCSQNCPGCYAMKTTRYTDTLVHYAENTILANSGKWDVIEDGVVNYVNSTLTPLFRWHDSGDIMSIAHLTAIVNAADRCPDCKFYLYTKEVATLKEYEKATGRKLLDIANLKINISAWEGCCDDIPEGYDVFYYDGNKNSNLPHCPAVDIDGNRNGAISCLKCRRCATKGKSTAVYPH